MKSAPKIEINLLPQDSFLSSPTGRVVVWMLTIGRYLLIFTLGVVIVSFLSRFNMDRKITDLNGQIFQQLALINSYGTLEADFRATQEKIQLYVDLSNQKNLSEVFSNISRITPPEVSIEKLTVTPDNIAVSGSVDSKEAFNLLINNLQLSGGFTNIAVGKVEASSASADYKFQFTADTTDLNDSTSTNIGR